MIMPPGLRKVTRVLEGSTGRRLLSFNEHSHLPRELVTYR